MRVLIVDDYPGTAEATATWLTVIGHECRIALCGAEALAEADALSPEFAIIDIGLPDTNGYELLAALRTRFPAKPLYGIALTGWAHELANACKAGFDRCFLKPADLAQLVQAIDLAAQQQTAQ